MEGNVRERALYTLFEHWKPYLSAINAACWRLDITFKKNTQCPGDVAIYLALGRQYIIAAMHDYTKATVEPRWELDKIIIHAMKFALAPALAE